MFPLLSISRKIIDSSMAATFEKNGFAFDYPDNWNIEDQLEDDQSATVSVYSPDGAFWMLSVHRAKDDPDDLCDTAVEAMRQEYGEVDVSETTETLAETDLTGRDLNFYCLDLTSTATIRGVRSPLGTLVVLSQAEDREFERVAPVFRAITTSLLARMAL